MVKHALVTGARGTVGTALAALLAERGAAVTGWDRTQAVPGDAGAAAALLDQVRPDVVYHLAVASRSTGIPNEGEVVNVTWSGQLAALCAERGIPFVFTSTVMVFSDDAIGPFTPTTSTDAQDGYGFEKRRAELAVRKASADARIVRLGWQIGEGAGSNNMMDHLIRQHDQHGRIDASAAWLPATSFLPDTAAALIEVLDHPAGVYHVDGNRGWAYDEIVAALAVKHGLAWQVKVNEDFVYDQRMTDPVLKTAAIDTRLTLPELES